MFVEVHRNQIKVSINIKKRLFVMSIEDILQLAIRIFELIEVHTHRCAYVKTALEQFL